MPGAARQPVERRAAGGLRGGPGVGERTLQCAKHELVHAARIAKPHLELLRMRIDVDHCRIHFQVQHIGRKAAVEQHVLIGEARGARYAACRARSAR